MAYIVNLSSLCVLHPDTKVINALTKLYWEKHKDEKSKASWRSSFGMWWKWSNWGSSDIIEIYRQHEETIKKYRMGEISTEDFLGVLEQAMGFEKGEKRTELMAAWNSMVGWDNNASSRFDFLRNEAKGPIYLISNSNGLHVEEIMKQLRAQYSGLGIEWIPEGKLDLSNAKDNRPIKIASNADIYLVLSYRYGMFKAETPGLLAKLKENLRIDDVTVVSQHPGDLKEATRLEFSRVVDAKDFYKNSLRHDM